MLLETADALRSVLEEQTEHDPEQPSRSNSVQLFSSNLKGTEDLSVFLSPGLLFFPQGGFAAAANELAKKIEGHGSATSSMKNVETSWDDAAMVGLSVTAFRAMSLASGSWVCRFLYQS